MNSRVCLVFGEESEDGVKWDCNCHWAPGVKGVAPSFAPLRSKATPRQGFVCKWFIWDRVWEVQGGSGKMGPGKEESQERACEGAAEKCWQMELKPLRDSELNYQGVRKLGSQPPSSSAHRLVEGHP